MYAIHSLVTLASLDMTDVTYWSVTWSRSGPFSIISFPTLASKKKIIHPSLKTFAFSATHAAAKILSLPPFSIHLATKNYFVTSYPHQRFPSHVLTTYAALPLRQSDPSCLTCHILLALYKASKTPNYYIFTLKMATAMHAKTFR
jgi:hypothetical protein